MNDLYPYWKEILIGIINGGERTMTGRIHGVVTRFEKSIGSGGVSVWCGLHELDIVMKNVFDEELEENVLHLLTKFIGYLRQPKKSNY